MEKPRPSTEPKKLKQLTSPVPPPPLPPLPDPPPGAAEAGLVAKSPPGTPPQSSTLQSQRSEERPRDQAAMRVLACGALQLACGVLMAALGVLALVHEAALARYGAGLWGGAAGLSAGLAGVMSGLRAYYQPGERLSHSGLTAYLALCLVGVAVSCLALVLTSTGLLRDIQQPALHLTETDVITELPLSWAPLLVAGGLLLITALLLVSLVVALVRFHREELPLSWAPLLVAGGLLLITALLLVSLVVALVRFHREVCPCTRRPPAHRLLESPASHYKQGLVHSWLGQQPPLLYPAPHPQLLVYPPQLLVDSSGLYTVPPSSLGYPPPGPGHPYMQRRRSPHPHAHQHPHPHRAQHSVTPDSSSRSRRQEKQRRRESVKEREITDEQLEKTYTGLDREIAEEFISIAMTNPESSQRSSQLRPQSGDKVIDCIAPM